MERMISCLQLGYSQKSAYLDDDTIIRNHGGLEQMTSQLAGNAFAENGCTHLMKTVIFAIRKQEVPAHTDVRVR